MTTYLSRAQSRFWATEWPQGDPYGGPPYGEKNDPVSILPAVASTVIGSVLTNAVTGGGSSAGPSGGGAPAGATSTYAADTAANIANDQWNYFRQNYQPLESNLINQAAAAGSPEEYARARGAARADVAGAFNGARNQTASRLQSYGINPGSPAYQSGMASADVAEGAATAGALTAADNNTRNLAYSKALDVVGLGRNIPAQSSASSANAANAATAASRNLFGQNQTLRQNAGYALSPITSGIAKWFGGGPSTVQTAGSDMSNPYGYTNPSSTQADYSGGYYSKGGKVGRYARGGLVAKHPITPHMKPAYAMGGGVGRQGNSIPDASNTRATIDNETGEVTGPGTGTSDEVPAQIDGQKPAALSSGEFVINASAVKMTGQELLTAINQAGLNKRQRAGLGPKDSPNDVPEQEGAHADGGRIRYPGLEVRRAA